MGFFSSLFNRTDGGQAEESTHEASGTFPELYNGMTLDLESAEGRHILSGRLSGYHNGDTTLTLERLPGGLSFGIQEMGAELTVRGVTESMGQFFLKGAVQDSTRVVCRLKDVKVKPIPEHRHDFRLQLSVPAALYYRSDTTFRHPEECTLVDISTGGACIESEYLHAEDEVLWLKVKLMDYAPMEFLGEIIRVTEYQPDRFRYGFLFAQLKEREQTELSRTLYNIQVGNHATWMRSEEGHW